MSFKKLVLLFVLFYLTNNSLIAQHLTSLEVYKTYAKVWGYVRFFHPSDEVATLKAERFAYYNVAKLQNLHDAKALRDTLTSIFKPIAPSIQFYLKGENPQILPIYTNQDSLQLVFWQHQGLGLNNFYDQDQNNYKSIHVNSWKDTIFSNYPKYGEVIEKEISANLFCTIPLALYKSKTGTLPKTDFNKYQSLTKNLDSLQIDTLTGNSQAVRIANVIIYWNTLNYFYPYFAEVGLNWETELDTLLQQALQPQTNLAFLKVLQKTSAKLQDAHAWVSLPTVTGDYKTFPFMALWIENRYLITTSNAENLKVGDEIISLGKQPIKTVFDSVAQYARGSSYLKQSQFLYDIGFGHENSQEKIRLKRKVMGKTTVIDTVITRNVDYVMPAPKPSRELENGIFYLNLTEDSLAYLKTFLPKLQKAKGVIIDMRGYPNGDNMDFLRYLSPKSLQSANWNVQQIYSPDSQNLKYEKSNWTLEPQKEQITCKKVFLTNANAQSQAETFMGIVEHHKLGEIIGQPTAGCNGNITGFPLLGNYYFGFTGMKVLKHDNSQHHLIGIKPTIPITYTEKDILEGRDLELEKALEILRK